MNIVDPSPDDITIRKAAAAARLSEKSLRRAVQAGLLPRRYVYSKHGLQLVFRPGEVERWLTEQPVRRRTRTPRTSDRQSAIEEALVDLRTRVASLHATLATQQQLLLDIATRLQQDELARAEQPATSQAEAPRPARRRRNG